MTSSVKSYITSLFTIMYFISNSNDCYPVDNFGTVVGENPTPYGILALWAVNGLSIVYWVYMYAVMP